MRHYLYLVNGWPTMATESTCDRYEQDALVGVYDDARDALRRFDELMDKARRAASRARAHTENGPEVAR